ncbi:hypothetical protein [Azospirillum argentinense]
MLFFTSICRTGIRNFKNYKKIWIMVAEGEIYLSSGIHNFL